MRMLVKGIQTGEACHYDRDGTISLDELYDYVYDRVVRENANQRPKKWDLGIEGKIIVAQTPVVRAAELAPELVAAIVSPLSRVRLGAIGELGDLLNGSHKGLAQAAREALENLPATTAGRYRPQQRRCWGVEKQPRRPQSRPLRSLLPRLAFRKSSPRLQKSKRSSGNPRRPRGNREPRPRNGSHRPPL